MARHSTKRPRELALEVIKLNKAITPSEIDKHVGGEYSSKYICQLRKRGFEFEVVKDGRNVVSYTLVKEPKNAADIRAGTKKQKAVKAPKAPKVAVAKKVAVKAPVKTAVKTKAPVTKDTPAQTKAKASNLEKIKAVAIDRKNKEDVAKLDALRESLKKVTPVSSVAVDSDFDEVEDVRSLL